MCERNTQLQSGLIFAWMLPRARLYTLFKAHGPVHSVVCWHLLVTPHIASPLERMSQAAQARAVAFAVSFETTNGQTHTIAVRFSLCLSHPSFMLWAAHINRDSLSVASSSEPRVSPPLPLDAADTNVVSARILFVSTPYFVALCAGIAAPPAPWHALPSVSSRCCSDRRFVLQLRWHSYRDFAPQWKYCRLE